jgi:nicotinamidase/pyrazinamidase
VVATQDWHPPDHKSFAANHPGKEVYEIVMLREHLQTLWPTHCVQGTPGAELHPDLKRDLIDSLVRKGEDAEVDSYSGFLDNDRSTSTGLESVLREQGITDLDVCGLAGDYCVSATALDGLAAGFRVRVLAFATSSVKLQPGDEVKAYGRVEAAGGTIVQNEEDLTRVHSQG